VTYLQNGSPLYTSTKGPTPPLLAATSLYSTGATVNNVVVVSSPWEDAVGVSFSGQSVTKTGPSGWNAGAATVASLTGDGYAQFTTAEATTDKMVGLSHADPAQDQFAIDFALYLSSAAGVAVYEDGVWRTSPGAYAAGDVFRIQVAGSQVTYLQNGKLLYTSAKVPTHPLLFGAALYTPGATVNNVVVAPPDCPSVFHTRTDSPAGVRPAAMAVADLDGDGIPDLAVADAFGDTLGVLLGNGDGTFAPGAYYPTASHPVSVAATDLNGDGSIDLVVAEEWDNKVSVLFNYGDGTFTPRVDYAGGFNADGVVAVDLNGDGRPDLAVSDDNAGPGVQVVSVLLNKGDGTFAPAITSPTGAEPTAITAADLNGDGKLDLVVTDWGVGANAVSVLIGNGDGTFAANVDYPVGQSPDAVAAVDLNGDGKPDLAVANFYGNTVSVLINHGDGTFAPRVDFSTGAGPSSIAAVDLNGDGKLDLAVVCESQNSIDILYNKGDGTFAANTTSSTGHIPVSIVAADLNTDGLPDLTVAEYLDDTVSVWLGVCGP
jgi:hypothetical protein